MSAECDPDVRPTWSETGLPLCDDACPSFDGKRCKAMGFRPDRFCEPELLHQATRLSTVETEARRYREALEAIIPLSLRDGRPFICGECGAGIGAFPHREGCTLGMTIEIVVRALATPPPVDPGVADTEHNKVKGT